ncbi:MAG: helix-turn-helix transcriptional regulator [Cyclobacteriaceae bacterium]
MSFVNSFFLLLSGQGFFLSFLLSRNKKIKSNPWISLYVLAFSIILLYWDIFWVAENHKIIQFTFHLPFLLLLGPMAYFSVHARPPKSVWPHLLVPLLLFPLLVNHWIDIFFSIDVLFFLQPLFEVVYGNLEVVIYISLIFYTILTFGKAKSRENLWIAATLLLFTLGQAISHLLSINGNLTSLADYLIALFVVGNFYSAGYFYFVAYKPYSSKNRGSKPELAENFDNSQLIEVVRTKKGYLQANYRLEDLSKEINISLKETHAFIRSAGYSSFKDLVNSLRIEHAKALLKSTNLKILAVALESGFSNKVTFIQNFKKATSTTPQLYRTKAAQKQAHG